MGGASGFDLVELPGVAQAAEDDRDLADVHRLLQLAMMAAVGLLATRVAPKVSSSRRWTTRAISLLVMIRLPTKS